MEKSQKQGDRHLTHTRQDYEDTGNNDYHIAECRLLGIVGHYRIKEKDTQAKITPDRHTDMGQDRGPGVTLQEEEQEPIQLSHQECKP